MKKIILLGMIITIAFQNLASAQAKKEKTTIESSKPYSEQWNAEHYIVDRDSAYKNPRMGLQKLIGGNKRFMTGKTLNPRQDLQTIKKLPAGQEPFAIIVGCSDSRASNEIVFDQGLGDLFVVRSAGQVLSDVTYGSIEYAVLKLRTKLIVVLGHTECGAVSTAVQYSKKLPGHLEAFISEIRPSVAKCAKLSGDPVNNSIYQNVIDQVSKLRNLEPFLREKYLNGEILIVGAVYNLNSGRVEVLQETLINLPKPKASAK